MIIGDKVKPEFVSTFVVVLWFFHGETYSNAIFSVPSSRIANVSEVLAGVPLFSHGVLSDEELSFFVAEVKALGMDWDSQDGIYGYLDKVEYFWYDENGVKYHAQSPL